MGGLWNGVIRTSGSPYGVSIRIPASSTRRRRPDRLEEMPGICPGSAENLVELLLLLGLCSIHFAMHGLHVGRHSGYSL